jgi:hypothetical protein
MPAAGVSRPCALLVCTCLFALLQAPLSSAATPSPQQGERVDFERHIMGLLGRMGCNSGSCHGSFQGKGGFRLSLFGYDPEFDYLALTRDNQCRRINPSDPDSSLILLKATGQIEHGGLRRFGKGSWQYNLFRRWIADGMSRDRGSGTIKRINIEPPEFAFRKAGEKGTLRVVATFADDSQEDITLLSEFRTNNETVATVSPLGEVSARQAGDTAIIVAYRGNILPVRVMVPMTPPPGFQYARTPEVNYIDREVFAKLRRLNIAPSDLAGDAEFLRRLSIDTVGGLPTPDAVRAFLEDRDPKKRQKKIDELLKHPLHAALWATKFCDITGNNTVALENPPQFKPRLSQAWHGWFRKRLAENVPYDQIVHDVLCATSREGMEPEEWLEKDRKFRAEMQKGFLTDYAERKTLDLFWRRLQPVPIEQWGEKTAVAFLGVRLECAQCHKHPFDRWTQDDYWAYANIFSSVNFGVSPEARSVIDKENGEIRKNAGKGKPQIVVREIFASIPPPGGKRKPVPKGARAPRTLGGPGIKFEPGKDPREDLFTWMRSATNPFFARSFVNRIWGHYFGIGIVHPVDDFSLANPASNDKLLDALAQDFIKSGYNIRKLERTILLSRTYQLSSVTNATNRFDTNNYSHSYVRPLMAEVVVDVINDALGTKESFKTEAPEGARAVEVGSTLIQNASLREAFRVFGRPVRAAACDCERSREPTVSHKLYLMADPSLQAKMQPKQNRLRALLVNKNMTDESVIDELFLATLSRYPTEKEKAKALAYVGARDVRQLAYADALWALVNTTEFIFNH